MEKFDLENFPTSESAKKMLSYVSDGFYDESYVGKWIYQVMGMEYDAVLEIVEDLPNQMFPETATWGLSYHEIKWGLPIRENLSYEERRRLIYQKRDCRAPMTPRRMERYLEDATGFEVHIADIHDQGEYGFIPEHPNVFKVFFLGEKSVDVKAVSKMLDRLKQSHTIYSLNDRIETQIDNKDLEKIIPKNILFKLAMPFWNIRMFDGTWILDGSNVLDAIRRFNCAVIIKAKVTEQIYDKWSSSLEVRCQQYIDEKAAIINVFNKASCFMTCDAKAKSLFTVNLAENELETVDNVVVETKTSDYWFLNGALNLDGSRKLNSIYQREDIR